ncbi:MAG TPA: hypothetical protein VFH90_01625 [Candidatus Limnocylindria bacterium]|nr:hypothetical protein [Candidatus Limnocylindria bacterium]
MRRIASTAVLALILSSCGWLTVESPPLTGELPPDAEAFRKTLRCAIPFQAGGTWWQFRPGYEWPPPMPAAKGTTPIPYPVPGKVVILSERQAMFIAESDGSRLVLLAIDEPPEQAGGCA